MALRQISAETITVQGTAIGITSTKLVDASGNTLDIVRAHFQHRSGGKIFALASATPAAAGGNGEQQFTVGDDWEVIGFDDLKTFKMIKQTGEADAVIDVQLEGAP